MNILVTCGPSYEPIDQVRRLTNLSTGELGVRLAERLAADGHDVLCLKGIAATHPSPAGMVAIETFTTNDDLASRLRRRSEERSWDALFHIAALCDYRVARCLDAAGQERTEGKVPSEAGALTLHLEPAPKVIAQLRRWFPTTRIAGWKYEVTGSPREAVDRGWRQIAEHHTDLCVVNGPACGNQFHVCRPPHTTQVCVDRPALIDCLASTLPGPSGAPQHLTSAPGAQSRASRSSLDTQTYRP